MKWIKKDLPTMYSTAFWCLFVILLATCGVRWFLIVLCSLALFVVTEPPVHQLIKSAGTVPLSEIAHFCPPSPQKEIFSLIPQNDLKEQRRRLSDPPPPSEIIFKVPLFWPICRCVWWGGGGGGGWILSGTALQRGFCWGWTTTLWSFLLKWRSEPSC